MYVIDQNNEGKMYYIYTDHASTTLSTGLGSPNLITDAQCNVVQELSYDAWGNRRDPATWQPYSSLASVPSPLIDRGFTFHEHLYAFTLINMNGRAYDPLVGRFLSADPYIQAPDNTQNLNRYSYCLNNPLRYSDESGEWFGADDAVAALIGGVINWASNGCRFDAKGLGYFAAGAAAGDLALYGPAGWAAGGAIIGASNAALNGARGWDIVKGAAMGTASSFVGGALGQWAGNTIGGVLINGFNVTSPVLKGVITGATGGAAGGYASGFTVGLLTTCDLSKASAAGYEGLKFGFAIGAGTGAISAYKSAKEHKIDPWSGKAIKSITIGEGMTSDIEKGWMGIDKISKDLNSEPFDPKTLPKESWSTDGELMRENGQWIDNAMKEGKTIYDRGTVGNKSQYYNMEAGRTMDYPVIKVRMIYNNKTQTIRIIKIQ